MIDYIYLQIQNPWWKNKNFIEEDEKVKEYDALKSPYVPQEILSLDSSARNIHLITGPRQTGKSTSLKLYIRQCLRKGNPPQSLMYFNCDALSSEKDIIDLIIEFSRIWEGQKSIIFLDEVSSVYNWPQGIKWLVDAGQLKNAAVFLTGSSSINLKKSGEFLPGRRMRGKDIVFWPVSFYDYLKLKSVNVQKIKISDSRFLTKAQKLAEDVRKYYLEFMSTGGFLRNINYGLSEETNDLYLKTLKSELFKAGKKEDSLREVVRKILNSLSAQTSYTNIAEEAELGSKNTAVEYLNFLSDSFFLKEVKFYNISQKRVILKKNKKFYATDPYLIWLFEGFVTGSLNFSSLYDLVDRSKIAENFIASELVKRDEIFFFWQNSREMDFYLPNKNLGVEVKYKSKIINDDINFPDSLSWKVLVSQNTLEKRGSVFIIPVYLFALMDF